MFEKEAEEFERRKHYRYEDNDYCGDIADGIIQAYQKGAEFCYNKANEWHYVKDGDLPEENQWVLVYDGSYTVCNYHSNTPIKWLDNYENEVYEYAIIAWREIVPPKEIKEND